MKTLNYKNQLVKNIIAIGLLSTTLFGASYGNYIDNSNSGYKKYRVISSTPITKDITKRVQIGNEIRDRVVNRRVQCGNQRDSNSIGLDTIIGTVAGIAIGNQIGKGNGRDAAKIIGGLGGGYMANQMRNSSDDCYEQTTVQDIIPRYDTITDTITTGYNNCVEVDSKRLCKESKKRRKFLKIKKTYSIY